MDASTTSWSSNPILKTRHVRRNQTTMDMQGWTENSPSARPCHQVQRLTLYILYCSNNNIIISIPIPPNHLQYAETLLFIHSTEHFPLRTISWSFRPLTQIENTKTPIRCHCNRAAINSGCREVTMSVVEEIARWNAAFFPTKHRVRWF
jgi:hypothetical protein